MISVVIPAHKEQRNLERLLPRLKAIGQNINHEIIVALSQLSTDANNVNNNQDWKYITVPGKGRAIQMNYGARDAKGDILAFLHADVHPPDSFFTDIEKTITQDFDAGFFSYRFDSAHPLLKLNALFTGRDGIFTGGGDQCLFIRKCVFMEIGGFDESQVIMEDFEFFQRMKRQKIKYRIVKNDLIVSARKYKCNSYARVNLANLLLLLLFKWGYPAQKLKILHNRIIRVPR